MPEKTHPAPRPIPDALPRWRRSTPERWTVSRRGRQRRSGWNAIGNRMSKVIIVTGAANSIGRTTCRQLMQAGHTGYVSSQEMRGPIAQGIEEAGSNPGQPGADLRTIEFDVSSESSVTSAVETIIAENGRLDVVVH